MNNSRTKRKEKLQDIQLLNELALLYRDGVEPTEMYNRVANKCGYKPEYLRRKVLMAEIRAQVRYIKTQEA